ncbi:MAG: Fe-S-containing hydro-lyase [Candidatus Nitrosotenuis sp.]|nr:MAG: Fe-S-containing hydro-lyase [Candidatus Nitrosotenuis sp.]
MANEIKVMAPLDDATVANLKAGDQVSITGVIYTARDTAHKRMVDALDAGQPLPFDMNGQVIYYVGPSPAKPGKVIGSAGPTTSYRMDLYAERLMEKGMKGMIGKGMRDKKVIEAMKKHKCVYFAAIGGAAALIARSIKAVEIIAYEDLGPEAVRRMEVEDFKAVVINDIYGNDLYDMGKAQYRVAK